MSSVWSVDTALFPVVMDDTVKFGVLKSWLVLALLT